MLKSEKLGLLCIPPLLWLRIDLRSDAIVASTGGSTMSLDLKLHAQSASVLALKISVETILLRWIFPLTRPWGGCRGFGGNPRGSQPGNPLPSRWQAFVEHAFKWSLFNCNPSQYLHVVGCDKNSLQLRSCMQWQLVSHQ